MKKVLSFLVIAVMLVIGCFVLTGCGNNNGGGEKEKSDTKPASKLESQSDLINFATNMSKAYKSAKEKDSSFSSEITRLRIMATVENNIINTAKTVFEKGTLEDGKYVYNPSGTGTYTAEFDSNTMSIKIVYVYEGETITNEAVYKDGYYYVQLITKDSWVNDTIRWKFNSDNGKVSYTDEGLDSIYKTSPASDFIK